MSDHDPAGGTAVIERSPITPPDPHIRDGWEVSARVSTADLTLCDETPLAKVTVRAPFGGSADTTLGTGFGRTARLDTPTGTVLVRIRGRAAPAMLAKVCGIDLGEQVTPDGAALRTSVAKVVTDVVRDDREGDVSYLLHCERSSGRYLCDALLDAGAEFGIEITGFDTATVRQGASR